MDQLLSANIPEPPAAPDAPPEAPGAPPEAPGAPPGPPGPPDEPIGVGYTPTHKATVSKPSAPPPMSGGGLLDGLKNAKLKKAEIEAKPVQQGNAFMTPEVIARMKAIEEATKSDDNAEDDDVWSDDD